MVRTIDTAQSRYSHKVFKMTPRLAAARNNAQLRMRLSFANRTIARVALLPRAEGAGERQASSSTAAAAAAAAAATELSPASSSSSSSSFLSSQEEQQKQGTSGNTSPPDDDEKDENESEWEKAVDEDDRGKGKEIDSDLASSEGLQGRDNEMVRNLLRGFDARRKRTHRGK